MRDGDENAANWRLWSWELWDARMGRWRIYRGGDNAGLLCFCRHWVKGGLCGGTWRLCVSIARTMGEVKRSTMVEMETMGSLFGETILCDAYADADADADADAAIYGVHAGWKGDNWGRM